VTSFLSDLL